MPDTMFGSCSAINDRGLYESNGVIHVVDKVLLPK
jgi:uncharacterized surface protein with fasciclin (FAS1) repeats